MAAPKGAPRPRHSRGTRQAVFVGLRRVPGSRGSRYAVQDPARRARARHAADERLPVDSRAKHGRDHRASSAGQVLRGERLRCHPERSEGSTFITARPATGMESRSLVASAPRDDKVVRLLDPARVVVFDVAMGKMPSRKGVFINQFYDELNLRSPELVRDIHRQYVKAGAEVIETNSFGANRLKLKQYGLDAQVLEINRAAAQRARDAAGDRALVAGAVGPLGV